MKPIISVIVPVYNVEQYIVRCIESLINQTMDAIEIILVDDGSTDKSGSICDLYAERNEKIQVIHKKNAGQGLARNEGIKAAEGKYISFVDSDDYLELNAYETITQRMEQEEADLACYGYVIRDTKGKIIRQPSVKERIYRGEEIREEFILHFFGDSYEDDNLRGISSCMSVYKKDVLDYYNILFCSERIVTSEDTIFNLDYCKNIKKVIVIQKYFYNYCQQKNSFSNQYQADRLEKTNILCEILNQYAQEYKIQDKVNTRIVMLYWISLMTCMKHELQQNTDFFAKKENIRTMCRSEETRKVLALLKHEHLPIQQKLYLFCVKNKLLCCIIIMTKVRLKRGL